MNDNESPTFSAALAAVAGVPHLRLAWSAGLRLVGNGLAPWERLHDRLLWSGYIEWLREDVR